MFSAPGFASSTPPRAQPERRPGDSELESGRGEERAEEEVAIVGADIMDEIVLGWSKIYRKQYRVSRSRSTCALGRGGPGLAPARRTWPRRPRDVPRGEEALHRQVRLRAPRDQGRHRSVGSLGKTATSVILVDKDNPIDCLSVPQLDAVYSKTRKHGYKEVKTWGDLGAGGE